MFKQRVDAKDPAACDLLTTSAIKNLHGYTNSFSGSCQIAVAAGGLPFTVAGIITSEPVSPTIGGDSQLVTGSYTVQIEISGYAPDELGYANVVKQGSAYKIDRLSP